MNKHDVIVIGGGAAGLSAAFTTAGFGKKTLLVEAHRIGGECTWSGCIPSKALIHLAEIAHTVRTAGETANLPNAVPADSPFHRVDAVRQKVYSHESPEILARKGIETILGAACFTGPNTLSINGETHTARHFVLAVGSQASIPPIPGLKETPYLTNESLFELDELPQSVLVLGGGPIGLEMAQALSRLGVKVTVVEALNRVLSRDDPDTAAVVRKQLTREGILLLTETRVLEARKTPVGISLSVEKNGEKQWLEAQTLLVAAGREGATAALNLEAAGVRRTLKGVAVNRRLQTSNRRIYAAGDVVGPFAFSHMAEYQGVKAALNIVLPFKSPVNYKHVAWATFTDPEIAGAGLSETAARNKYGKAVKVYTQRFENLDRGRTAPGVVGLAKIILGKNGRILGAHIAGPRAGDLICEIQVLKAFGLPYQRLRKVIHPYPTYADILRQISKQVALDRILDHPVMRLLNAFKKNH